jgi:F-type H+-transporting ATPase subunit delta
LRDRQLGVVEARARVARPLDAAGEQKLTAALEGLTGKRVRLQVQQDAALLGGVVVRVGDTVYDGSVRHQLESLREQLGDGVHGTDGAARA